MTMIKRLWNVICGFFGGVVRKAEAAVSIETLKNEADRAKSELKVAKKEQLGIKADIQIYTDKIASKQAQISKLKEQLKKQLLIKKKRSLSVFLTA
jgi:preprotein translocase subunit SecF